MSYDRMDHAGWVETSIAAHRRRKPTARERKATGEGKGWFAAPERLSPFQRQAFDILGIVGGGIYNAPIVWDGLVWNAGGGLMVPWRAGRGLSTWDFQGLTDLVFLAHDARIRVDIVPHGPGLLAIATHPRVAAGPVGRHHPDLAEAVAAHKARFPAFSPLRYAARWRAETADAVPVPVLEEA